MAMLMAMIKKLEGRVGQFDGQLAAILRAIRDVGLQAQKPSSLQAPEWPALGINTATAQAERSRATIDISAAGSGQTTSADVNM